MALDTKKTGNQLRSGIALQPSGPLWQRVPSRDSEGRYLSDFMMIIPGLKHKPGHIQEQTVNDISEVLLRYSDTVVFADLNLKLNVLWVSLYPKLGMCLEISAAIKVAVPEALLVSTKRHE